MWVKNYTLSKIYNFNWFDALLIQQRKTEANVTGILLSFLPYKILKASRVCESRLLANPWFCLHFSVIYWQTHHQRF